MLTESDKTFIQLSAATCSTGQQPSQEKPTQQLVEEQQQQELQQPFPAIEQGVHRKHEFFRQPLVGD